MSGAGVIIAVIGKLSVAEAQQLAACRTEGSQGIALLLDVSSWADAVRRADAGAADADGRPGWQPGRSGAAARRATAGDAPADRDAGDAGAARTLARPRPPRPAAAAAVLRSAGWHVTIVDASTPLAVAWQRLPRAAEMLVADAARRCVPGDWQQDERRMNLRLTITAAVAVAAGITVAQRRDRRATAGWRAGIGA